MRIAAFLLFLVCCAACQQKTTVDLLVHNANIYTVNDSMPKATAFAVKAGKIVSLSQEGNFLDKFTATAVLDAQGKTIVPGLIDAHCHFYGLGMTQQIVNLRGTTSYEEVLQKVSDFNQERPANFIQGRGWDQNDWEHKEFPTKAALDHLFPDTPVALQRVDGHAYLVNQKALDMAGITAATKMSGGDVVLDKNGQPTGILVDAPMALVDAVMPKPKRATQIQALKDAQKICLNHGLTTVDDAGLDREVIELIDSLQQTGDLKIRVYAMVSNTPENLDYYLDKGIVKTNRLNVRSVKVYGDGALGSRGAALKTAYTDKPGHFGAMITPAEALEALANRIAATDYQMNTHAIGDSSNVAVLRAYDKALAGKTDRRWRVEHAQVIADQDFDYFAKGIIPSVQPTHATSDMYWAEDRLGHHRVQGAYAYKTLLEKAGTLALGTDFPVEKVNPFLTFYAAVARQDLDHYPEGGFQVKDALSRVETLKGMTLWAAHSNFEEHEKGSIAVGKQADFVVLDQDVMTVATDRIPFTKAVQVYIAGEALK